MLNSILNQFFILIFALFMMKNVDCVSRQPFHGRNDLKYCQERYGKMAQGTFNPIEEPNNCLIYCNVSNEILKTWRPDMSYCGVDKYCMSGECSYENPEIVKLCVESFSGYNAGEVLESNSCKYICYNRASPTSISDERIRPVGTQCSNARDYGAYGQCDTSGQCNTKNKVPFSRDDNKTVKLLPYEY